MPGTATRSSRNFTPAGILAGLVGLALFVWAVRDAGVQHVLDGLRRVGWGFLLILVVSSIRPLVRTIAWRLCLESSERLPLGEAFTASVTGTALGDLTPLGLLLSEPAKAMLVRDRLDLVTSFSALTVENLFYSVTVLLMILAGTAALLVTFSVPPIVRLVSLLLVAAALAAALFAAWVLRRRRRVVSGLMTWLGRWPIGRRLLLERVAHVRELEDEVFSFSTRHEGRLLPIWLLEGTFHVSAIFEGWIVLALLGVHPTLLMVFVLEYIDRVIIIVFKFVPLRLGVDEVGTGLATDMLGLGTAPGVALAIVRKARVLFWTALGVVFLMRRGLSVRRTLQEAGTVAQEIPGS
ncbi:MAG TPA: lysylphosphatidylglycerol synthase domain-containing protein [Vicinamibacterales bacterium]|nr:lysylphosphatidylglycerol synthase domain-containing protein [Vicinamibacterales bacterium]